MRSSGKFRQKLNDILFSHPVATGLCVILLLIAVLALCWNLGSEHDEGKLMIRDYPASEEELRLDFPYIAPTELDRIVTPVDPLSYSLSECNGDLAINAGGDYILSGELRGSVIINAPEQNVHLFLNNAVISALVGPAIHCIAADKLTVTLLPGTENRVTDSGRYDVKTDPLACIYSVSDITFNGSGSLSVSGLYKDAIRSKDIIKILSGDYSIRCKRTAIHGNDGIFISGGSFSIQSEKYGLKTENRGPDGRGNLMIVGGDLELVAGRYSFVVELGDLYVYDCSVFHRSLVELYDCGGRVMIAQGCVQR